RRQGSVSGVPSSGTPVSTYDTASVASERRADADLVALGVRQHGEGRRPVVGDQGAACCQRRVDALLRDLRRHREIEMEALPWLLVRFGLLVPTHRDLLRPRL